jgi:hypothetical protein
MIANGVYPFHNIVAGERIGHAIAAAMIAEAASAPVKRVKRSRRVRMAVARVFRVPAAHLVPPAFDAQTAHRPLSVEHGR